MNLIVIGTMMVLSLVILIVMDRRKQKKSSSGKKTVSGSLQEFLPIQRFHEDGSVVVNGRYRRLIRVGDMNLYSMAIEEIRAVRDRFKNMLQHLDNPFQISVQARRANYTDYVKYTDQTIQETMKAYQNSIFSEYAMALQEHIKGEAQKPRTDRENLIVIGVLPKVGGESEKAQLEKLDREQGYVESGLSNMGVPYKTLGPIEVVEAVQNFWNRERAVSQRYRDAIYNRAHTPMVSGSDVEVDDIARL